MKSQPVKAPLKLKPWHIYAMAAICVLVSIAWFFYLSFVVKVGLNDFFNANFGEEVAAHIMSIIDYYIYAIQMLTVIVIGLCGLLLHISKHIFR